MSSEIVAIDASVDLGQARSLMKQHGIHHLLVYEGRTLAGVLSARDLEREGADDALTAGDLMTTRVVKANADAPLPRLANLMRGHAIGCLVVTERGRPVGVITTADLLDVMGRRVVIQTAPKNRPQLSTTLLSHAPPSQTLSHRQLVTGVSHDQDPARTHPLPDRLLGAVLPRLWLCGCARAVV